MCVHMRFWINVIRGIKLCILMNIVDTVFSIYLFDVLFRIQVKTYNLLVFGIQNVVVSSCWYRDCRSLNLQLFIASIILSTKRFFLNEWQMSVLIEKFYGL